MEVARSLEEIVPLDTTHKLYLYGAFCLISGSLYQCIKITQDMFFGENKKTLRDILKNPVLVAWYLLLPPEMMMMGVYFIEHARMLAMGSQSTAGGLCTFIAFWACTACVVMNGAAVVISYVTYRLVKDGKKPDLKVILIGNGISWGVGLLMSLILVFEGAFGPYQGFYCCIKEELYSGAGCILYFIVFFGSTFSQMFFYIMSYKLIKETEGGMASSGKTKKASVVILKRGGEMIFVFYGAWSLMIINSFVHLGGGTPSHLSTAIAAFMAKTMPILHAQMMRRNLTRIKKIAVSSAAASSQHGSSANEDEDMDVEKRVQVVHDNTMSMLGNINSIQQMQSKLAASLGDVMSTVNREFGALKGDVTALLKKIEVLEASAATAAAENSAPLSQQQHVAPVASLNLPGPSNSSQQQGDIIEFVKEQNQPKMKDSQQQQPQLLLQQSTMHPTMEQRQLLQPMTHQYSPLMQQQRVMPQEPAMMLAEPVVPMVENDLKCEIEALRRQLSRKDRDLKTKLVTLQEENLRLMEQLRTPTRTTG